MPFFKDIMTQLNELLAQQTVTKKLVATVILLAVLVGLVTVMLNFGKTIEYEVLYAGLDDTTARAMREELTRKGIRFKVDQSDRGWSIKVPGMVVLDTRLDLANSVDLLKGHQGWELFDKPPFGMTDFTMKINRQRATQGELARTIMSLDAVKSANVNLAVPEKGPFITPDADPKASVVIALHQGMAISPEQVHTIQSIVAGSVEGLKPENVSVADTLGNELTREDPQDSAKRKMDERERLVGQQEKQRKDSERMLEHKIMSSFARIFGEGHVEARVNIDYDFTVREESIIKYDPKNVVRSEATTRGGQGEYPGVLAMGLTGTAAHIPPDVTPYSTATSPSRPPEWKDEHIVNHEVGMTETRTQFAPYQIKRVTASIVVDHPLVEESGQIKRSPNPLEGPALINLENQVKQIIGYSEDRPGGMADSVTVTSMRFNLLEDLTPTNTITMMEKHQRMITYLKIGLLALGFVFAWLLLRPIVRIVAPAPAGLSRLEGPAAARLAGAEQLVLAAGPDEAGLVGARGEGAALPSPQKPDDLDAERQMILDDEILALARENPKKASMVLRSWIDS